MIVEVLGAGDVRVVDVEDLTRLHLALGAVEVEEADAALRSAGLGRLEGDDTGYLDIAALRAAAEPHARAENWAGGWDGMIGYARSKGWVADDGASLQVHVESAAG